MKCKHCEREVSKAYHVNGDWYCENCRPDNEPVVQCSEADRLKLVLKKIIELCKDNPVNVAKILWTVQEAIK